MSFNTGKAIQNNLFPAVNVVEVIPTDNGRIEVVDGVLLPPLCPSQTAAFAGADFSILRDVLGQTNLSSVVDTLPNATIFAPTNAAFNAALAELGKIPNVNVSDPAVIASVLLYHVVPAVAYSTQLPDGASEVPSSLIVDGKVQMIPITKSASGVVVGRANVTIANVGTCNGVVSWPLIYRFGNQLMIYPNYSLMTDPRDRCRPCSPVAHPSHDRDHRRPHLDRCPDRHLQARFRRSQLDRLGRYCCSFGCYCCFLKEFWMDLGLILRSFDHSFVCMAIGGHLALLYPTSEKSIWLFWYS